MTARRRAVGAAAAFVAALLSLVAALGLGVARGGRDLWVVLDVSRSAAASPAAAWEGLRASSSAPTSGDRLAAVVVGADAVVARGPEARGLAEAALPRLPEGFAERTRLAAALDLVLARRDVGRATEIVVRTDGRSDAEDFRRASRAAAQAGVAVRVVIAEGTPVEDLRLVGRGPATPSRSDRVRVAAAVAGTHRAARRVRVLAEPPAEGAFDDVVVPPGGAAEIAGEIVAPSDATEVVLRLADAGGDDARPANDRLRVPVRRREGMALLIDDGARTDGAAKAALRDALGPWRVERRPDLSSADSGPLGAADLVVLVDQDASDARARPFLEALAVAVEARGVGLAVLGGPRAYRAGGYAATPLERLLPLSSRPPGGRDVRVLLDVSGSMEREGRLGRATDATLRLAEALGPDDVLRVRPYAATPRPPIPARPAAPRAFLAEASAPLRALRAGGGTRLLGAVDAELEDPATEGRRRVFVVVGDADDPELDDAAAAGARRARAAAEEVDVVCVLLDPRPETIARASALGGRVEPVLAWTPRLLLDAVERESFVLAATPTFDPDGRPTGEVPWRNLVREGVDARVATRAADGAPLVASARRGAGRVAAAAAPLAEDLLAALLWGAARDAAADDATARRSGEALRFEVGPARRAAITAESTLFAGSAAVPAEERAPGIFEAPWRDAYAGDVLVLRDSAGAVVATAPVDDGGDPEWSDPPLGAGLDVGAPFAKADAEDRDPRPWLVVAAAASALALLCGFGRRAD